MNARVVKAVILASVNFAVLFGLGVVTRQSGALDCILK